MTVLTFATAFSGGKPTPLQKVFRRHKGQLEVISYPGTMFFSTRDVEIKSLEEFAAALREAGSRGECLFKGNVSNPLVNEPRVGALSNASPTDWVCLDFDKLPGIEDIADILDEIDDFAHTSYVVQYASSHKIDGRFSAHVFMLLDQSVISHALESWLVHLNLTEAVLAGHIHLNRAKLSIAWPLDPVPARNTQIIYIAPPKFEGMQDPVGTGNRIKVVKRQRPKLLVPKLPDPEKVAKERRQRLRHLQIDAGMKPAKLKTIKKQTVLSDVTATISGIVEMTDKYVRVNINGGDSAAYWFWRHDPTFLYSFKDETEIYLLEELDADFYRKFIESEEFQEVAEGKRIVAFMMPGSGSSYHAALYEPRTDEFFMGSKIINVPPAMTKDVFYTYLEKRGFTKSFKPDMGSIVYDPTDIGPRFDPKTNVVNKFRATKYMRAQPKLGEFNEICPSIDRLLHSALGNDLVIDHFLKWFAFLFKERVHVGTGWLIQGVPGTGKSMLVHYVLKPLIGDSNFITIGSDDLADRFNDYISEKLLVFLDEADLNKMVLSGSISARLKRMVGNRQTSVRKMYKAVADIDNYSNLIMATNVLNAVTISMEDRRFNVADYQLKTFADQEIEPVKFMRSLDRELDGLAGWLLACQVNPETIAIPIQTDAKKRIQENTLPSAEHVTRLITQSKLDLLFGYISTDWNPGSYDLSAAYEKTLMRWLHFPKVYVTREELISVYKFHVPKFMKDYSGAISEGQFLGKQGFDTIPRKIDGATKRVYMLSFDQSMFSELRKVYPLEKAKVIQIKGKKNEQSK